jgi:hypothetical protein
MNLIKQFMKMGGFKSPQELEAYGEENFFRDFPEAKKLAMGGTPEAFPQIATADQFFSYGVPVPPTYHRDGGATGLPNIYPQIQSEQQFFAPVYTNSNNAYEVGGSYQEAFPQAVSFPNKGWGKTNYFMLQSGGNFPPGMPQFTGMLPVMQSGSELAGIDSRTQEDMNHYYGTPYPMMAGGQPSLQAGGQPTGTGKDSFYTDKMQNFIGKIQNNGQKALMKSIELVDEAPPMSGMRYGGIPKYQSKDTSGQYDVTGLAPGSMMLDPNNPNYNTNVVDYNVDALGLLGTPSSGSSAPAAGSGSKPAASAPAAQPKSNSTTSGGVSTATATKARTAEELKAEVDAEKKKQESGTTAAGTTGTSGSSSAPAATGPTNSATTTTSTTGTTPTGWEGWRMVELNDGSGRRVPVDSSGRMYFDTPYQSGPQYYQYPQGYRQPQQQANYGNFLDYIPGGGLRRKSANALLGYALSGVDLRGYVPTNIKTRAALLPGNRIKSFDLVKQGVGQGPYRTTMPTESAKTTQVPAIQDPNTFQSAMPAMTTDQKVQMAYNWNYRPNQPSYAPAGPVIGPEGPVKQPSMMSAGNTDFDYSSFNQTEPMVTINPIGSNVKGPVLGPSPYVGTEVNTGGSTTFDKNNPQHREAMLKGIMEGMRHGGPYALPMFQSTDFSGEKSNIFSAEMPPFDGAVAVNAEANNTQNMYWDTGVNDFMDQQAREIEKEADPFRAEDQIIKDNKIKRKGLFADLSADQMIAGMDTLAGFFNKYGSWNQEDADFNSALQVHGKSNARNSEGSYFMNQPGIGLGFRPRQATANVRGMYAQYGGQPFYYADTYYMTMPTIKNVKKAGAYKFGK